jgi:hypothetical protein
MEPLAAGVTSGWGWERETRLGAGGGRQICRKLLAGDLQMPQRSGAEAQGR